MTDGPGLGEHRDPRGLVELRLDELFPGVAVRHGRLSGRDGAQHGARDATQAEVAGPEVAHLDAADAYVAQDDGGDVDAGDLTSDFEAGDSDTGGIDADGVDPGDLDAVEIYADDTDAGDVEEADPFAAERRDQTWTSAKAADRAERPGRVARLVALTKVGRWRIDPGRRGAMAVMAAILVAAAAVGWQALASRPHAEPVADTGGSTSLVAGTKAPVPSGTATTVGSAPAAAAKVIVDVVGRVHRAGLVRLPAGARVADAIRAAGGALAGTNLSSINLARVCVDGEQIAVGVSGATAPASTNPAGAAPGSGAPTGLVNLNTASADQLDALPGVGPVMAQRILAYRTDHGPFTAVSQLQQVSGIGAAKYADLRPLVTV